MSPVHSPFPLGGQLVSKVGKVGVPLSWGCIVMFSGGAGVAVVGVTPCTPGHLEVFPVSVPVEAFY